MPAGRRQAYCLGANDPSVVVPQLRLQFSELGLPFVEGRLQERDGALEELHLLVFTRAVHMHAHMCEWTPMAHRLGRRSMLVECGENRHYPSPVVDSEQFAQAAEHALCFLRSAHQIGGWVVKRVRTGVHMKLPMSSF
jgi:hypothetical protein